MQIPMSFEHYERIPRHPDWKWEYWDGAAHLSYRPFAMCLRREVHEPVGGSRRHAVRLIDPGRDEARLRTFLSEFWRAEDPGRTFEEEDAISWLRDGLDRSFARLAEPAGALAEEDGELIGAVLLEPPHRDDEVAAPQLSWLSVRAGFRCDGVGTDLLAALVEALRASGAEHLASAASPGNRASLAWHWRNGFQIVSDPLARFGWAARRR
ncbi:MAG: GNAT family N-acetyltransferase [Pseudonocardia sp.]